MKDFADGIGPCTLGLGPRVICGLCCDHAAPSQWGAPAGSTQRDAAAEAGESPRVRRVWGAATRSRLEGTPSSTRERLQELRACPRGRP